MCDTFNYEYCQDTGVRNVDANPGILKYSQSEFALLARVVH